VLQKALAIYSLHLVSLKTKIFWLALGSAIILVTNGCSGINATHSVSPASFFLPGLMKADPPPTNTDPLSLPTSPEQS
jgi:hypothetical protein